MKKLYQDRGMMKWQGLILSEHAEMISREKNKPVKRELLFDEQQLEEFDQLIHSSIHLEKEIVFELNTFGDDSLLKVSGGVSECSQLPGQQPYFKLKGYNSTFRLDEIVSISFAAGVDGDGDTN
ncbi:YolD-like family protein [Domibacillus indicus]|uniref:YolD-like family protein n=1 Tax=Domibacillus indicus TaxID=1437523 RepID=UPI00203AD354|nr:YolD-like family protein [Domibacillus indicus]MCM3790519.1 YolD-like family protein [Domibacillus indicus]